MQEQEIIKKLQDKTFVGPYGLMEERLPGSQDVYRKAGKENLLVLYCYGKSISGIHWRPSFDNPDEYPALTYAISPDYQPEPEYVEECPHSRTIKKDLGLVHWYRDGNKKGVMNTVMLQCCLDCKKVWVYDYAE